MPGFKSFRSPWFWLRLLVAMGLLYLVVARSGKGRITEAVLSVNPYWALLAGFVFFCSILAGAYQWNLLLRMQGIHLGFATCFRSYYSAMFLNNFMPGTVGGDALRIWDVHRIKSGSDFVQSKNQGLGKAAAATFLDRLLGFSALAFFSFLAMAFELGRGQMPQHILKHLIWAVGAVATLFAMILLFLLSRRIAGKLHFIVRVFGFNKLESAYAKIEDSLAPYKLQKKRIAAVFVIACLVQLLRIYVHVLSAWALHLFIAPAIFLTFIPLIALAAVLPLNVGGWGLPQSLGAYLYALPGMIAPFHEYSSGFDPQSGAAALAFLPTVIGMFVMLGGGFYFVLGRKPSQRLNP